LHTCSSCSSFVTKILTKLLIFKKFFQKVVSYTEIRTIISISYLCKSFPIDFIIRKTFKKIFLKTIITQVCQLGFFFQKLIITWLKIKKKEEKIVNSYLD